MPLIKLTNDILSRYSDLTQRIKELSEEKETLRKDIVAALKGKRKPAKDSEFTCEISSHERSAIPWEEEANRWKDLAMKLAADVGKDAVKWVKKQVIEYPKIPVERLLVSPKREAEED